MTFTETLHPRGQAANPGQFRSRENTAPAGSLDFENDGPSLLVTAGKQGALDAMRGVELGAPDTIFEKLVGRAPEADDHEQVTEISDAYNVGFGVATPAGHTVNVTEILASYEDARADHIGAINQDDTDEDAGEAYEDSMLGLVDDMATALRQQRDAAAAPVPAYQQKIDEWQNLLADVGTMGGDEIRSLPDAKLIELESYLLRAAERVQAARHERGIDQPDTGTTSSAHQLEVIRYDNVTEDQITKTFVAGREQGKTHGIIRTYADFHTIISDEEDVPDSEIEAAWTKFQAAGGLDEHVDGGWAEREWSAWDEAVQDAWATRDA